MCTSSAYCLPVALRNPFPSPHFPFKMSSSFHPTYWKGRALTSLLPHLFHFFIHFNQAYTLIALWKPLLGRLWMSTPMASRSPPKWYCFRKLFFVDMLTIFHPLRLLLLSPMFLAALLSLRLGVPQISWLRLFSSDSPLLCCTTLISLGTWHPCSYLKSCKLPPGCHHVDSLPILQLECILLFVPIFPYF